MLEDDALDSIIVTEKGGPTGVNPTIALFFSCLSLKNIPLNSQPRIA